MDLLRFVFPEYREALARFLADKYLHAKPDIIITVYPSALRFILRHADSAFSGIPVVACSVYESDLMAMKNEGQMLPITGTFLKGDIGDIIPVIRSLRPQTRRIALVTGSSEFDKNTHSLIGAALRVYEPELEIMEVAGLPMSDLLGRLGSLPSDSVVLYSSVFADGAGEVFVPREALRMVAQAANVPVFGLLDSYFGYGIVGGGLLSFEAHGQKAAKQALRILTGESPTDIPFTAEGMRAYMFDWRELNRWGLNEEALPQGSSVNRCRLHI